MTEKTQLPAPDWHDRPTCPGLWLTEFGGRFRLRDSEDWQEAAGVLLRPGERVYGPIPKAPYVPLSKS